MATLKICVQKQRTDGTWPVYIRETHKSRHGYIKTDKKGSSRKHGAYVKLGN